MAVLQRYWFKKYAVIIKIHIMIDFFKNVYLITEVLWKLKLHSRI